MYALIDKNKLYFETFRSKNMEKVMFEYLSLINYNLALLDKYNIKNMNHLDNIFVVKLKNSHGNYPIWENKWSYNFNDNCIYDDDKHRFIPVSSYLINLLKKINKKESITQNINNIGQQNKKVDPIMSTKDIDQNTKKNLEEKIREIENMKKIKEQEIEDSKSKLKKEMENYSEHINKLGDEKRTLKKEKDKMEENRRIFENDKNVYFMLKSDIEKEKIKEDDISIFFKKKYPVFKFMDDQNILNKEDEYLHYKKYYNQIYETESSTVEKKEYIPHNYHYLDPNEQEKYKNSDNNVEIVKEEINFEDFMNKQSCVPETCDQ
jgi:hypothetical protein